MKDEAFASILEFTTNTFYNPDNVNISVRISDKDNYYDQRSIVLAKGLMDSFVKLNLPRFMVYYHELGHHLYTGGLFKLEDSWRQITSGPLMWQDKYHHLLNWIEDFYIEDRIVKDYPYLTDVLTCIKKVPPEYDINRIEYAFNFWYVNNGVTPALSYIDQVSFAAYIKNALSIRSTNVTRFGHGPLLSISIKPNTETKFAQLIIEFYQWCQDRGIFPKDRPLEALDHPSNYIQAPGNTPCDSKTGSSDKKDKGEGSYSEHSHEVGVQKDYVQRTHIQTPTKIFKEEIATENRMIDKEMIDLNERQQTVETTIDGLFNSKLEDTSFIQSRIIVPNFFNPNHLLDQILFRQRTHTYMNAAIYRDISGSVHDDIHKLMHHVCEKLMADIPVDVAYYLYSSGQISVVKVPYIPWEIADKVPKEYKSNPLYKQLEGGTNSDAIADVITEQFSEKWLNIIVTDGDLHALMNRENIGSLLKNVFVVYVGDVSTDPSLLHVKIKEEKDIENIYQTLSQINL